MVEKFDPAPEDKHAAKPGDNKKQPNDELEKGLKDTFPGSDPVSSTNPSKVTPDGG